MKRRGSSIPDAFLRVAAAAFIGASAAATAIAAGPGTGFPPIPQGYYAYNASCEGALAGADAEYPPQGLVLFTATGFLEPQPEGGPEITGFDGLGGGRWRVLTRSAGNGEGGAAEAGAFIIRVTGPDSFETEGYVTSYAHCPTETIPAAVRRAWFEN
jgi:hypothetical protein